MIEQAMKKAVIFDCDGTLIDSLNVAMESFNFALDEIGFPPRTPDEIKKHFGAAADRIFLNILKDEKKAHQAFRKFLDHQSGLAERTKMHPGVREMLDQLAQRNVLMGLVTGRHTEDLDILLKPHRLKTYFKAIVADSELPKSKPAPDGLLKACQILKVNPNEAIYIGDSPTDIQAARNAGMDSMGVTWDQLAKPSELKAENPNFIASTTHEALQFLLL